MKIVVADKLHSQVVSRLREKEGIVLVYEPSWGTDQLIESEELVDADALVVRSTKVPAKVLERGVRLSLVIRAGAGVNNIDLVAASQRAVMVCNCPGQNARAVSELALGLLLCLDRKIASQVACARQGQWRKGFFAKAKGIKGLRAGIIGTGAIGEDFIRLLQSLGVKIVAWSRSLTEKRAMALGVERAESLLELAQKVDLVSVHLAYNQHTEGLLDQGFFEALPKGAYFINTSRAEVVDPKALLWALEEKDLRAGLDVHFDEPSAKECAWECEIASHPNVVAAHHVGASTEQSELATGSMVISILKEYESGLQPSSCVNLRPVPQKKTTIVVRHHDRVGVLAGVMQVLKEQGLNVQAMSNHIFADGGGAIANIEVQGIEKLASVKEALVACEGVLQAEVKVGKDCSATR